MGAITGEAISAALTVRRDDPTAMVVPLKREELMPTEKQMSLMFKIATTVVKARGAMVPASCDTPEKAFGLILAGHELGLAPMTALRHMYAVNGVTQPDTQVMMGVVRSKDPSITFSFPEYTETAVTCIMRRRGQDPLTIRYTVEDAKRSGQMGKAGPWTQYTRDMLSYSCAKRCVKLGAPDLLNLGGDIPLSMATAMADAIRDSEPEIAADDVPLESIPAEAYNPGDEPEPPVVDAEPADDAPELAGQFVAMLAERGADVDGDFPRWAVAYFGGGAIPSLFTSAEPARLNNAIGALKVASKRDMTAAQAQYDAWRVKQAPAPVGEVARA